MTGTFLAAAAIFVYAELAALVVFAILNRILISQWFTLPGALKGVLERLVLFVALLHGYPQMLIAFGAMKLGTRLHEENDAKITNTYFLVGNLTSMLIAMVASILAR